MENSKMMGLCSDCVCTPVCAIYCATGGVKSCVHYHPPLAEAHWVKECMNRIKCPICNRGYNTDVNNCGEFCTNCGSHLGNPKEAK